MPPPERCALPHRIDYSETLRNNWAQFLHSDRYNLGRLKQFMAMLISSDARRGPQWRDQALESNWASARECRIGGNLSAIYTISDVVAPSGEVVLVRATTHSEWLRE